MHARLLSRHHARVVIAVAIACVAVAATVPGSTTADAAVLRADTLAALDPIARLQARLETGELKLAHDSAHGYLPALLRALEIPVSSQGLVFSRTSLQTDKITPWSPRALYFNDEVYVGFVQESHFLEIAAMHPTRGAVFYTLSQESRPTPRFTRETTTCLMCHQSRAATGGVPGLMVLSTIADRFGYPIVSAHDGTTTDATPVRQRFGGWYVTGTHGDSTARTTAGHSGNVYSPKLGHEIYDKPAYRAQITLTTQSGRRDLSDHFDPSPYLSGQSDIVALMVLVHQTTVHNLLTAVHEAAAEVMLNGSLTTTPDTSANAARPTGPQGRLQGAIDRLLRAMLFADEAPLLGAMRGTTTFREDFATRGPRDHLGRSLREFDLETRLFKHPLSFLIYSESFDALPPIARTEVYRRLHAALKGLAPIAALDRLTPADRAAIRDILMETKPEFAAAAPRCALLLPAAHER
jgi:hypothetical protein